MRKEKTIKITEFGMMPELVGAIIKYIMMASTPVNNKTPIQNKPHQKRVTVTELANTLAAFIIETREGFKNIQAQINNLIEKNNLKT
jgi:hypothetical protein